MLWANLTDDCIQDLSVGVKSEWDGSRGHVGGSDAVDPRDFGIHRIDDASVTILRDSNPRRVSVRFLGK